MISVILGFSRIYQAEILGLFILICFIMVRTGVTTGWAHSVRVIGQFRFLAFVDRCNRDSIAFLFVFMESLNGQQTVRGQPALFRS